MSLASVQDDLGKHIPFLTSPPTPRPLIIAARVSITLLLIAVFLINAVQLGSLSIGQISNLYPTFITPAGYAFAIWGVIYALLGVFMIYQLFPSTYNDMLINRITTLVLLNFVFNICWIIAFQLGGPDKSTVWISLLFILLMLITLFGIYYEQKRVKDLSWVRWICTRAGFQIYLGWVTCATIVNAFVVAGAYPQPNGVPVATLEAWAISWIVIVGVVGIFFFGLWGRDVLVTGTICWAVAAIAVGQQSRSSRVYITAIVVASVLGLLTLVLAIWNIVRWNKTRKQVAHHKESTATTNAVLQPSSTQPV